MQSESSDDDWRPGFAKRAPNFAEVCERAERWRWQPGESVARIAGAVLKGTPTLTLPQRLTLLLYVEHLNQDRLEQDIACVWPSSALIADYLGCSESTARANRRALEAAGYMVRDYTRANRPAGVEAYDLAPLVARLDEMEAADAAVREAAQARRALYSEAVVFPRRSTARAPEDRRLEQSHENDSYSVQERTDAPSARSWSNERRAPRAEPGQVTGSSTQNQGHREDSAICSPRRASGLDGARPAPSVRAEMVRQELLAAVQVCPRLAPLVPAAVLADPASAGPADAARIAAAAEEWLPEAERNNGLSVSWGWRRHGPRVIAMLAIALEDPAVRDRCKYFGWMATRDPDGAPDLRLNFARIMRAKGDIPAIEAPPAALMDSPGAEDPKWQAIDAELQRIVRQGAYGSWFGRIGFHGIIDGVLTLSTLSGVAADRLKRDFVPAILEAAQAAGEVVERVVITVRRSQ
jgi:Replication protein C N-terminal domain